ncbi:MAG: rhodanese-like domain-containing protein [Cyanobacteriota bacterium]|nr:rhodanese-like domain-containing protein [Cyanobacteriota bacterium]
MDRPSFSQLNFPTKSSLTVLTDLEALNQVLSWFDSNRQPSMPPKDWLHCQLALVEGFTNAVRHAHRNLAADTPIELEVTFYSTRVELRIWDFGPPFDLEARLKELLKKSESQPDHYAGGGRGLILMRKIADALSYTRFNNDRNCLFLVRNYIPNDVMTNYLVGAEGLAACLNNPRIAIADCRFSLADPSWGQHQYQQGHIPGAYYLDLDRDLSSPPSEDSGRHPLPDSDCLASLLTGMGIDDETLVVAYDDSNGAFAARFWWLLRYLGHDRVALLDGGWSAWVAGGYPTTADVPAPRSGEFKANARSQWVVDREMVKKCKDLPGVVLIDSRDRDRFLGEREPIDPIAGHIPGAVNFPWRDACDERGYFRSPAEQKQRWAQLNPTDEMIVYCGSGVTACTNLWSMAVAGLNRAKLYPGGWSEWCTAE